MTAETNFKGPLSDFSRIKNVNTIRLWLYSKFPGIKFAPSSIFSPSLPPSFFSPSPPPSPIKGEGFNNKSCGRDLLPFFLAPCGRWVQTNSCQGKNSIAT